MLRVDTLWTGAGAVGGGITQMFFTDDVVDAQAAADAVQTFWDGIDSELNDSTSYAVSTTVTELNPTTGALVSVVAVTTDGVKTGTASGDMLSPATQGLIRLQTGSVVNGRILRGRVFVPAVDEFYNGADGAPTAGYITAVTTSAQFLIVDPNVTWGVWHRPVAGSGGSIVPITSASVSPKWAVLRSRRD